MTASTRRQEMARLYVEEGLSYEQIADEYGISRQRVGQLIGRTGLADRGERRKAERLIRLEDAYARIESGQATREEETERLGYTRWDYLNAAFKKLGLRLTIVEIVPEHGTINRYRSRRHHCRCEECRRANREWQRRLIGREPPKHGASGYKNYACRCKTCREGHRVKLRRYKTDKRQRRKEAA